MLVKTKAIVLSALKYQEKSLVVKCFTESDGLKSYFVHNAFSGKSAKKIAYFQPLTLLEIEASHKNKGTLETFREIRLFAPYTSLPTDIVKSSIALFISELLHNGLKEEEANPAFFTFLETAFLWLDHHDEVANFHLVMLLQMTRFLGFYPTASDSGKPYFDLVDGVFTSLGGLNALDLEQSELIARLLPLRFEHGQGIFSVRERRQLLKILLDYYTLHLEGFRRPRSLEVLQQLFG